jgi:L-iditol 2-dehydrogenase
MRGVVLGEDGRLAVKEMPRPEHRADEILVRARVCGLCGSDLYKIHNRTVAPGTVLGHEVVGEVVSAPVGYETHFPQGTRVSLCNHIPCGSCSACVRNRISMCPQFQKTRMEPGGFAEYIAASAIHIPQGVLLVPATLADETALLAEPLGCCLRALDRWDLRRGEPIAVIGLGVIGVLMVLLLRWKGMTVVGIDPLPARREFARTKGCHAVYAPRHRGERAGTVSGAILTVSNAPSVRTAIEMVEPGGWIGLFAGPAADISIPVRLQSLYRREIDLIPAYSTGPNHMQRAMQLLSENVLDVEGLFTHRLPIEQIQKAVELAQRKEGLKTVLYF